MQVSKWGNSLAIRLPAVVVEALKLEEGDDIEVVIADSRVLRIARKPDREALLVPPGDSAALAAALQRLLASPESGRALAQQARTRVAAEYDSRVLLPRHAALARSLLSPSA